MPQIPNPLTSPPTLDRSLCYSARPEGRDFSRLVALAPAVGDRWYVGGKAGDWLWHVAEALAAETLAEPIRYAGFQPETLRWRHARCNGLHETNPMVDHLDSSAAVRVGRSSSSVYFIRQEGGGPIKIGIANHVPSRLAALQLANPYPLRIVGTMPGGIVLERRLHARFAANRLHGEWFEPVPELLAAIAEEAEAPVPEPPEPERIELPFGTFVRTFRRARDLFVLRPSALDRRPD